MSFDDVPEGLEVEKKKTVKPRISKEFKKPKIKDPFEARKQELRDKQEDVHEDPKNPYAKITIPDKGKIGKPLKIKFNHKVANAQVAISQKMEWKKRDKYDRESKPELVCNAFIIDEFKDVKKIDLKLEDIGYIKGVETNMLRPAEYMIEVRAWDIGARQETNSKRLIWVD